MPIPFSTFPANLRTPHVGVEIDSSLAQAGLSLKPHTGLIVAQLLSSGTVAALTPTKVTNAGQASVFFGAGSVAHNMAKAWLDRNAFTPLWVCGVVDNGTTYATGTLLFAGTATASGTAVVYVGGRRHAVAIAIGDTAANVATNVDAVIGVTHPDVPVTSGVVTATVTFTARNAGTCGNEIDLRVGYYADEVLPAGITVTLAEMGAVIAGATDPDITTVWPVLGETWYTDVAVGWSNAATVTALETEFADRWEPDRMLEAHGFMALRDTHSNLITTGNGYNSPNLTVLGANRAASSSFEIAASLGAMASYFLGAKPSRPLQTLEFTGLLGPVGADVFDLAERNLLLFDGIATYRMDAGGKFLVDRAITTYQTSALGAPDTAFLDIQTRYTLAYLSYDWRTMLQTRYPRHMLGDDGVREFGAGNQVMTPLGMKGEAVTRYRLWMSQALVEDLDAFKANVKAERNPTDPNRLDTLLPVNLINQLRIVATLIQFTL